MQIPHQSLLVHIWLNSDYPIEEEWERWKNGKITQQMVFIHSTPTFAVASFALCVFIHKIDKTRVKWKWASVSNYPNSNWQCLLPAHKYALHVLFMLSAISFCNLPFYNLFHSIPMFLSALNWQWFWWWKSKWFGMHFEINSKHSHTHTHLSIS